VLANQAQGDGAGIYAGAPLTATKVVVSGNTSTVNGGGIYNEGITSVHQLDHQRQQGRRRWRGIPDRL